MQKSAVGVISIIIDTPAIAYAMVSSQVVDVVQMQISTCKIYKHCYYLAPPQSLLRKQNKTVLMLCKPLFIIHVRVKGFFKVILEYKNEAPQLEKWA